MKKMHSELVNNPSFCALAWTGVSISPTGTISPCCLIEKSIVDDDDRSFRIYENDFTTSFNANSIKHIRQKMLNGELVSECSQCYKNEEFGGISLRKQVNADKREVLNEYSDEEHYLPTSIDLKLNNKCNLKCRMCQPQDSNLIYNEFSTVHDSDESFKYFQNSRMTDHEFNIDVNKIPAWESNDDFIQKLSTLLPTLKKISLVGGEPLILEETFKILDLIVESGFSKNINLCITTNLTTKQSQKIKNYFDFFHKVLILISFDGTDNSLSYIRYPTKQSVVLKNLKFLNDSRYSGKNTFFSFAITIQAYNAIYLTDIFRLVDQLQKDKIHFLNLPISFTYLNFPEHLSINILPEESRAYAIKKIETFLKDTSQITRHPAYIKEIYQILGRLKTDFASKTLELQQNFLYYTNILDKTRGQRFSDFLPILHKHFCRLNIEPAKPKANVHQIREEGWRLASDNKLTEALSKFLQSSQMVEEKDYIDFREMAWIMLKLGKSDDSIVAYEKAFSLNPTDKHIAKGIFHAYLSVKKVRQAFKYYDIALELNPNDSEIKKYKYLKKVIPRKK